MTRKVIRDLSFPLIALALVFSFVFSFAGKTHAANPTAVSPIDDLKIDTVDGVEYSSDEHKDIAWIIVEKNDQEERVLGFSTPQKFEAYQQQVQGPSFHTNATIKSGTDYFYEHTSNQNYGKYVTISSGTWVKATGVRWGSFWNDRISSLNVAPWSWVTLYQHNNYGGYAITFSNRSSYYLFSNLTSWRMSSGKSWNDQVSSIKSGNY
nr:hypothetical protein [uncultured Bacillus sp.]